MNDSLFTDKDLDQEEIEKERKSAENSVREEVRKEEKKVFSKRLYVLDGYSIIYRSYFAHISNPLTDGKGVNISAYFGFFSTLLSLLTSYRMDYLAIAMDEKAPTFRHEMYPEYKATRDKAPEDLHAQVPMIKETLSKMNISTVANPGFEADDVIASLTRKAEENETETIIVTGDKDLMQLVGGHVSALRPPKKGESQYRIMQEKEVEEEYGVKPSQIVDFLSIIGDKADNVPGIKGLGEKGAVKLLSEYVSLDGIYRHLDMLPAGTRKKLEEGKADGELSKKLILLRFDALPSDFDITELSSTKIDAAAAAPDFEKRSCRSLLRRIGGDKADNVPGIKGLGEKGAVKLLSEYVTLEGIYRHIDMLAAGVRKKLEEGKADAVILAVAHERFKELDVVSLAKERHVLFDVKGVLKRENIDGRL